MEDFVSFQDELTQTTKQAIEYANCYLLARKEAAHCDNQLLVLIWKAGLQQSKKSIDNKIAELMANPRYGEEAREINEAKLNAEAEYKGFELVVKSYLAHASGLQSIIKTQISGEMSDAMRKKYGGSEEC